MTATKANPNPTQTNSDDESIDKQIISFQLRSDVVDELDAIAGDEKSRSEILRRAAREFTESHDADTQE